MKTNSLWDKRTGGEQGEWLGAAGVLGWNRAVRACGAAGPRGRASARVCGRAQLTVPGWGCGPGLGRRCGRNGRALLSSGARALAAHADVWVEAGAGGVLSCGLGEGAPSGPRGCVSITVSRGPWWWVNTHTGKREASETCVCVVHCAGVLRGAPHAGCSAPGGIIGSRGRWPAWGPLDSWIGE